MSISSMFWTPRVVCTGSRLWTFTYPRKEREGNLSNGTGLKSKLAQSNWESLKQISVRIYLGAMTPPFGPKYHVELEPRDTSRGSLADPRLYLQPPRLLLRLSVKNSFVIHRSVGSQLPEINHPLFFLFVVCVLDSQARSSLLSEIDRAMWVDN